MTLSDVAARGNQLETLKALRDVLAEQIDITTSGRDLAPLTRQLQIILTQISEIENGGVGDDFSAIIAGFNA